MADSKSEQLDQSRWNNSLLDAVRKNNADAVRNAIIGKANIGCQDQEGDLLAVAASAASFSVIPELIRLAERYKQPFNVDSLHKALFAAINVGKEKQADSVQAVDVLLQAKASPIGVVNGQCLVDIAMESGHAKVKSLMIYSALENAVKEADLELIKSLFKSELPLDKGNYKALIEIAKKLRDEDVTAKKMQLHRIIHLLEARIKDNRPALHVAVLQAKLPEVRRLLKDNADVNLGTERTLENPLHYAVAGKSTEIVSELLEAKANPNLADSSGRTPLHKAVALGKDEYVKLLLTKGADINLETFDPIKAGVVETASGTQAASSPAKTDVKKSEAPAKTVSVRDTPLHLAMRHSDELVKLLLDKKADWTKTNSRDETPLHVAVRRGDMGKVQLLLGAKAVIDPEAVIPGTKDTLAHLAASSGNVECMKLLMQHGVNLKKIKPNANFEVPFTLAIRKGSVPMVRLLIQEKAGTLSQPIGRESSAPSPLSYAVLNQNPELVKALLELKANAAAKVGNSSPLTLAQQQLQAEPENLVMKGIVASLTQAVAQKVAAAAAPAPAPTADPEIPAASSVSQQSRPSGFGGRVIAFFKPGGAAPSAQPSPGKVASSSPSQASARKPQPEPDRDDAASVSPHVEPQGVAPKRPGGGTYEDI